MMNSSLDHSSFAMAWCSPWLWQIGTVKEHCKLLRPSLQCISRYNL